MDHRLRELQRRFQESGSLVDEVAYLRALRQVNQLDDASIGKAAYFGSTAADQIVPYDVPYRIAEMMSNIPVMEGTITWDMDGPLELPEDTPRTQKVEVTPPKTSWFCNDIYRGSNRRDVTEIWSQIDMIATDDDLDEAGIEIGTVVCLLLLYWISSWGLSQSRTWWGPTAVTYGRLRKALIEEVPIEISPHLQPGADTQLMGTLGELVNYIAGENPDLDLPHALQWSMQRLLELVWAEDSSQGRDRAITLCEFVARRMRRYLLGYQSLEQTLPTIH